MTIRDRVQNGSGQAGVVHRNTRARAKAALGASNATAYLLNRIGRSNEEPDRQIERAPIRKALAPSAGAA